MTEPVRFILDDKEVLAQPGETIWEVGRNGSARSFPISVTVTRPGTGQTATAVSAWWRSRANGCWHRRVCARRCRGCRC